MELNEDLFEDGNIDNTSIEDKFKYLKEYEVYKGNGQYNYTRPCKTSDLNLNEKQLKAFDDFLNHDCLVDFWEINKDLARGIFQVGRMGGHLVLSTKLADPQLVAYNDSFEDFEQDQLARNYDINYDDEEGLNSDIEENHQKCANTINDAYNNLIDFDNRVNQLIEVLKNTLDEITSDNNLISESLNDSDLDKAYNGSYYTITGCGGDLQEWKDGYQELLNKEGIGTIKEWITFKGSDMNNKYHLTGGNAYPEDLTFLAFSLDGLEIGKLSLFKLKMQDRWFDDIVDNNARREIKNESLNESQTRFSEINSDLSQEIFNVVLPKKVTGDELVDYMYQFNDGLKAGINKMELLVALKDAKSPDDFGRYIYNNSDPDKYRKIYNESKKLSESNVIGGEVEYIETYNDCKIYKLASGEFSAEVHDSKIGSRNVSGESIEEVRRKIDKADKDYRQHFYNLPEAFNGGQTPGEFVLKMAQGFAKDNPETIKKLQNKEKTIEQTAEELSNQFSLITKEMWEEVLKAACFCDTTPIKESYKVVDEAGNKVAQGGGFKSKEEAEMFAAQYGKEGLKVVKESFDDESLTEIGTNKFGDKQYKYKGYTISYFPYDVEYDDKTDHFESYIIESPAALKNGYRLPLHCEDENGEVINFLSLEAAKKWIDVFDGEFKLEVKNGNEIHAVINSKEINESFEDEHGVESISEEQPQVEIPAENPQNEDNGLVSIINNLIQDEFNTIQSYKDAIVNFANQGKNDLTQVLKDILDEENIHVGQLETLLKSLDSSAENIEQGKQEAEEQIEINKGDNI